MLSVCGTSSSHRRYKCCLSVATVVKAMFKKISPSDNRVPYRELTDVHYVNNKQTTLHTA